MLLSAHEGHGYSRILLLSHAENAEDAEDGPPPALRARPP